jgi:nucleotide-binding universal stress UspA family protein
MKSGVERIVVSLDAASENATAIDTAASLAAHWDAHLHGVFVEDEDLLNLAGLPFARQITLHSGAEPLTAEEVERHLRAAAETARQALGAAAARHGVKSSFEVIRGSPRELLGTSEGDFVVACSVTRPIGAHFRVECCWWSSIGIAPGSFLLARCPWNIAGSVLALLRDREPASARVLEAAARLAEVKGGVLTVLAPFGSQGFDQWITGRLAPYSLRLQIELAPPDLPALHNRISELDCRLLVVEASAAKGSTDGLRELSQRLSCDLLFVQ